LAMLVMLWAAGPVSVFVERRPSVKILALAFLLLIGVMLVAEGMGSHVEKGYIYFAMAFSLFVEMLNLRYRRNRRPVSLHHRFEESDGCEGTVRPRVIARVAQDGAPAPPANDRVCARLTRPDEAPTICSAVDPRRAASGAPAERGLRDDHFQPPNTSQDRGIARRDGTA